MAPFRKHAQAVRLIGLIVSSTYLIACTQWRMEPPPPVSQPAFDSTKTYRVLLPSGKRVVIEHPRVVVDSLVWLVRNPDASSFPPPKRRAISIADVQGIEAEERAGGTLGTAGVVLVAVGFLRAVLSCCPTGGLR